MNQHIFREYDIRGTATGDLAGPVPRDIGRAVGTFLLRSGIGALTVGRDCRLSSGTIHEGLLAGLLSTGIRVVDIGTCHTPLVYFAQHHLGLDGAVMITGSHNPPEYNGFKVCCGRSTIYGEDIQRLRALIERGDFVRGTGTCTRTDMLPAYLDCLASGISLARPLKVVVDAGNGTGGVAAVPLLQRLGCEVVPLYCEMDGHFPHHHPDPTVPAGLQELIAAVRYEQADAGIGYDGDGDRIGVVDETGRIIWGDHLMIIYARDILKEHPGATFISEVKGSQNLYADIARRGGRAIMWKTGHSLIKAKMQAEQALLAGEMSGHMFFADRYFGFDDAVYATCRLLEILARAGAPLSSLLADVPPTCTTPEIRIKCPDETKAAVVAAVTDRFRTSGRIIDIDGARIEMTGGWALVRASNTQPALVLRFEADTPERLEEIRAGVESTVRALL